MVVEVSPLAPPPRPQPTLAEMLELHGRGIVSNAALRQWLGDLALFPLLVAIEMRHLSWQKGAIETLENLLEFKINSCTTIHLSLREGKMRDFYRGSLFTMVDSNTSLNHLLKKSRNWRDHDSSRCHARGLYLYLSFSQNL